MKIDELSPHDRETLEHKMKFSSSHGCWEPILDPPSMMQLLYLRQAGYFIGPNQEVMKADVDGMLRECYMGLPCTYFCGGLANGKCKQIEFPSCGVADGACMFTGKPCNNHCKVGKENAS